MARLLADELGQEVSRSLLNGGHDLTGIPGWAVEVKRHETLSLGTWWTQAEIQAKRADARPALLYRQSRQPWRAVVRLSDIQPDLVGNHLATLTLAGFCLLVRESLP